MVGAYSIGDWIGGRFQVFDVHEGGMSLVYVVNDQLGGSGPQVVALKTLRGELLGSRIRISRFAAECRIWVQLGEHANIVRAHSVEVIEGRPYAVLELIQGGDLSRWIGTQRLDLAQALRFGYQFCVGMEHALRQGLHCHRDIKPGNLLVTEDGTLKITDFGLARVSEEMVAVRAELSDGSIPLAEPTGAQPIIWSDPRDQIAPTHGVANICSIGQRQNRVTPACEPTSRCSRQSALGHSIGYCLLAPRKLYSFPGRIAEQRRPACTDDGDKGNNRLHFSDRDI